MAAPGAEYAYASASFILLAETMARLSETTFAEALSTRLTGPLGMSETTFDARPMRARVMPVHGFGVDNRLVAGGPAALPGHGAAAGRRSVRHAPRPAGLGRALLPSDPLARGTTCALTGGHRRDDTQPHRRPDGRCPRTASNARLIRPWAGASHSLDGRGPSASFTHGGITGGRLWVDPDAGFAVVFLTNLWHAPIEVSIAVIDAVYRARDGG